MSELCYENELTLPFPRTGDLHIPINKQVLSVVVVVWILNHSKLIVKSHDLVFK